MALLITAAFTSVILVTVVEGQGESAACLSALQSLASNVGCFTSFVNIGNAIDMGTRVPDADISTVCATFCKMLILEISTECDTEDYEGIGLIVEIGCLSNGVDSCIQVLTLFNDGSGASGGSGGSGVIPCDTDDCPTCSEVEDLVTYGGCCAYEYAVAASNSLGGFTADQLIAFCDVANPGNCTRVFGGGAKMAKGIGIFTLFITAALILIIA
ncbi:uncharacterized protein [Dysidea avara]|uniref:uncharacterized protein n=1 Tax=Dysidea avara TaxID=196820 RepID=UPI003333F592